jgi:peptidoglycan/LPS O-acetylase OafA/YrhL
MCVDEACHAQWVRMKLLIPLFFNALALLLFGIGLIGPLASATGKPGWWALLVFGAMPIACLAVCGYTANGWPARIAFVLQAVSLLAVLLAILSIQTGALGGLAH